MMQITLLILKISLSTVQRKQRLMNFSILRQSRSAEEREFEISGTN